MAFLDCEKLLPHVIFDSLSRCSFYNFSILVPVRTEIELGGPGFRLESPLGLAINVASDQNYASSNLGEARELFIQLDSNAQVGEKPEKFARQV